MTNEEKAKEYSQIQIADTVTERRIKEAYLNACEWKDNQFKEYLEKKKADIKIELRKNMSDVVNHSFNSVELALIDEIINELLGEEK